LALFVAVLTLAIRALTRPREPTPPRADPEPEPEAPTLGARLEELDAARGAGFLTDEEYAKKRSEILERF
jgi:hypothetical protein